MLRRIKLAVCSGAGRDKGGALSDGVGSVDIVLDGIVRNTVYRKEWRVLATSIIWLLNIKMLTSDIF